MIKTTIQHFIMDYALHTLFNGLAKNFFSAPKDYLSNIKVGYVDYMEVHYNGYIIKGSMEVVEIVNITGYDSNNNKSYLTFIHLSPTEPVKIFDHISQEDYIEGNSIGYDIEYEMQWMELVDDSIDEYVGEFAGTIAITPDDIIKAK